VSVDRSIAVGQWLPSAWSRSRLGAFLTQPISWVFIVVGSIIAFLSLYPTVFLFYGSLTDAPLGVPGQFTLQNYVRAYSDPEAYPLLLNSFIFGLGSAGLSVVFALTLAWITIRTNAPTVFRADRDHSKHIAANPGVDLLGHVVKSK
jgi:ABC-type sugar transport system permease subunit